MAATGKVIGTVTAVVGEVKATAADGTVRVLQVGDQVHADEVINTGTLGSLNVALAGGGTLDCGADTNLPLSEGILGVGTAVAQAPSAAPTGDIAALQAAIAAGADPSRVAEATAAGGAPAAGGQLDGGSHSPVIIDQSNAAGVVSAGFSTSGASIGFGSPEFQLLPIQTTVPPEVSVIVEVPPQPTPPPGGGGIIGLSGNTIDVLEGTDGGAGTPITFLITLDKVFDQPVQVTWLIQAAGANPATLPGQETPGNAADISGPISGTVTIPAGQTGFLVTVFIVQDHFVEGSIPETFKIVLIDAVNATINPDASSVFVNIVDDDLPPIAGDDAYTIDEGQTFSANVLANDTAQGPEELRVITVGQFTTARGGSVTIDAQGNFTYTPPHEDFNGNDSFTYTIRELVDGQLISDPSTATVRITVNPVNDAPVIHPGDVAGTVYEAGLAGGSQAGVAVTTAGGSFTVSDVDHDTITLSQIQFSIDGGATYTTLAASGSSATVNTGHGTLTLSSSDGGATWTWGYVLNSGVDSNVIAGDQFKVTVTDGTAQVTTEVFANVAIVDDVPEIHITQGNSSVFEGSSITNGEWSVRAGPDGGVVKVIVDGKTYDLGQAIDTGNGTLTINSNLTWIFQAPADNAYLDGVRNVSFTLQVTDGDGDVATDSHALRIDDFQTDTLVSLAVVPTQVTEAGATVTYTATLSQPVREGDAPLTVTLSNGQTITIVSGTSGSVQYTFEDSDDVYVDPSSSSVQITATGGGSFENLVIDPTPAVVQISDTIDTVTVGIASDGNVNEATAASFTVSVSQALDRDLTVTLGNGDTVVIAQGQTSAKYIVAAQGDDVYVDPGQVTVTVAGASVQGATFEHLVISPASATAQISDTIDTVTVGIASDGNVNEATAASFTVSVSQALDRDLTVTLGNGDTVVIAQGHTSAKYIVAAQGDDVYVDPGQVTVTVAGASVQGATFEHLVISPASATAQISDTIDTVTVGIASDGNVNEATAASFTVSVSQALDRDLTVTLGNGDTVVIAQGHTSAKYIVAAQGDDVYVDPGQVTVTVAGASVQGATFEHLVISPASATVQISDTIDTVTATLSTTTTQLSDAGGTVTYTVTLTGGPGAIAPKTNLVLTLDSGDQVTILAGQISGSVGHTYGNLGSLQQVTNSIAGISSGGSEYEKLLTAGTVTIPVQDSIPVILATKNLYADEDDIPGARGNPGGTGDLETQTLSGRITYNLGGDTIKSVTLSTGATGLTTLSGAPIQTQWDTTGKQLVGYAGTIGNVIFTITVVAVTNTCADYQMVLYQSVRHPTAGIEDDVTLNVTVAVTDSDNSVTNGSFVVSINDDSPALGIYDAILRNSAGMTVTGHLADIGADLQNGTLKWSTDFTALNNLKLTSLNVALSYSVSSDGTILTAKAGSAEVFKLTTDVNNGTYTLSTYQPLDLASLESKISSKSVGGGPEIAYYIYNDGSVSSTDLRGTASNQDWEVRISGLPNSGNKVQAATDGFGLNNNLMNAGETVRFELDNEGISGGKDIIYQVKIGLNQQFDPATIKLSYSASVVNLSDEFQAAISSTTLNQDIAKDGTGHWILTIKMTAQQILNGWMLDYVDVKVESGNNFKIDSWQSFSLQDGPPVTLPVGFTATDGDLDAVSGTLNLTFQNQTSLAGGSGNEILAGGADAETLSGGAGNDILIGGGGNDILTGGTGNDVFKFKSLSDGIDTITDFTIGNVTTNANADVLDVHDVLGSNSGNISSYVYFQVSGTTATLFVDPSGSGTGSGGTALAHFTVASGTDASSLLTTLINNHQILV